MPSRIDPAQLSAIRTLVQAVDQRSLTAAGRRLGLTPSAVSKQLSRLEQALGVRLLERTTRRVRPTAAGLELAQRARPLFEALDDAGAAVRAQQAAPSGRVRITAARAFAHLCLLPLLARLAAEHAGLEFEVLLDARRLDFVEDDIDLAVREGPLQDSSLTARRLGTAEVVLCAAPAYLRARRTPRQLADLEQHDLLALPSTRASADLARLRDRDGSRLRLTPRFRVNDVLALRTLAEQGAGIAALPDYVAAPGLASGALARVLPKLVLARLPIHAVYPSRRHLPRRVAVVLDGLSALRW
ncbi:MAG: LysR family transcriptional regulator [Deltaproteobacteria bacterium]|nr:LysR family transcriptional regulator [Deltaproteobacteria bacterium]